MGVRTTGRLEDGWCRSEQVLTHLVALLGSDYQVQYSTCLAQYGCRDWSPQAGAILIQLEPESSLQRKMDGHTWLPTDPMLKQFEFRAVMWGSGAEPSVLHLNLFNGDLVHRSVLLEHSENTSLCVRQQQLVRAESSARMVCCFSLFPHGSFAEHSDTRQPGELSSCLLPFAVGCGSNQSRVLINRGRRGRICWCAATRAEWPASVGS